MLPKWGWCALVEENSHLCWGKSATGGVFQDSARLRQGYAGEPLDELTNWDTIFEVLEQGCDRYTSPAEHPGAAYVPWNAFYRFAGGPINHV